jgi:hypothetical protein
MNTLLDTRKHCAARRRAAVIDVDSFVGEVCGRLKQGAVRLHQALGVSPDPRYACGCPRGVAHPAAHGSANMQKGMLRFTDELIARVTRAGASGVKLLRADSGF